MPTSQKLGQHWLRDPQTLQNIAHSLNLSSGESVLEIGPGLGTLTAYLLRADVEVLAVEYDPQLAENLPASFPGKNNLKVLNQDIRKFNFEQLQPGYKLATNLPYYISGLFFRILTTTNNKPTRAVVLIQKEVAQKIAQTPQDGDSNKLAMLVTYYYQVELGLEVGRRLFDPPPKVDSQVLVLSLREQPLFDLDFKDYSRLIRIAFASPRKTLLNNLAAGLQIDKTELAKALAPLKLNLDQIRAEHLSLASWHQLFDLRTQFTSAEA